jgi:hypothetical protein
MITAALLDNLEGNALLGTASPLHDMPGSRAFQRRPLQLRTKGAVVSA